MSRYSNELPLNGNSSEILKKVYVYLKDQGFKEELVNDETVWKKGKDVLTNIHFIKLLEKANSIYLEAWINFTVLSGVIKEIGITGIQGFGPKFLLRKKVRTIEKLISKVD